MEPLRRKRPLDKAPIGQRWDEMVDWLPEFPWPGGQPYYPTGTPQPGFTPFSEKEATFGGLPDPIPPIAEAFSPFFAPVGGVPREREPAPTEAASSEGMREWFKDTVDQTAGSTNEALSVFDRQTLEGMAQSQEERDYINQVWADIPSGTPYPHPFAVEAGYGRDWLVDQQGDANRSPARLPWGGGIDPNQALMEAMLGPELAALRGEGGGGGGSRQVLSYEPIDYSKGFPESPPQIGEPDYGGTDAELELSRPHEPEMRKNLALLSFLSGAAGGAAQGQTLGQSLAGAGAMGLQGLVRARTWEDEIRNEHLTAMEQWHGNKAQIMSDREGQKAERLYRNDNAIYEHQIALAGLQLKTQEATLPTVQSTAGGLMITSLNPSTGMMETKMVSNETLGGTLQSAMTKKLANALSAPDSLFTHTFDPASIDVTALPVPLWSHGMAAMAVMNGLAPFEVLGQLDEDGEPVTLATLRERAKDEVMAMPGREAITGMDLDALIDRQLFSDLIENLNNQATEAAQAGLPPEQWWTTQLLGM